MNKIGPGALKCVIVFGDIERALDTLGAHASPENIRQVGGAAILVHTEIGASELRDMLSAELGAGASLLVIEFEKWSGYGESVDREWLVARGH